MQEKFLRAFREDCQLCPAFMQEVKFVDYDHIIIPSGVISLKWTCDTIKVTYIDKMGDPFASDLSFSFPVHFDREDYWEEYFAQLRLAILRAKKYSEIK